MRSSVQGVLAFTQEQSPEFRAIATMIIPLALCASVRARLPSHRGAEPNSLVARATIVRTIKTYLGGVVQRRHASHGRLVHVDPQVLHQVVNDRVV